MSIAFGRLVVPLDVPSAGRLSRHEDVAFAGVLGAVEELVAIHGRVGLMRASMIHVQPMPSGKTTSVPSSVTAPAGCPFVSIRVSSPSLMAFAG